MDTTRLPADEQLSVAEAALRLDSDDAEAWARKGDALARLGRREEAVHWLFRAWSARARLADGGEAAALLLTKLRIVLEGCEECGKRADGP